MFDQRSHSVLKKSDDVAAHQLAAQQYIPYIFPLKKKRCKIPNVSIQPRRDNQVKPIDIWRKLRS